MPAVADDQKAVVLEEGRQLIHVGLELTIGFADRCSRISGVFKFKRDDRKPVHEQNEIQAPRFFVLDDCELVHDQPVVIGGVVRIKQHGLQGSVTVLRLDSYRHTITQISMETPIIGKQFRVFDPAQLLHRFINCCLWQLGIDGCRCVAESIFQQQIGIGTALRRSAVGGDVRPEAVIIAQFLKPRYGDLFEFIFGEVSRSQIDAPFRCPSCGSRKLVRISARRLSDGPSPGSRGRRFDAHRTVVTGISAIGPSRQAASRIEFLCCLGSPATDAAAPDR